MAKSAPGRRAARAQLSTGRRLGIMLAIVAAFAVGAVLGHNSVRTQPGTATAAPTTSARQPPQSTAADAPTASDTTASDTTAESETSRVSLAEVTGACGGQHYVAQVGYVSPLPKPIDMTIIAGSPPRVYDLSNGTVGPPLLQLSDNRDSVTAIGADSQGTVVAVRACTDLMSTKILRITNDGTATPIEAPAGWRAFGGLTTVDGQAWAVLTRENSGRNDRLLAADGSGKTRPAPNNPDLTSARTVVSPDGNRVATIELNTDGTPGYHVQVTNLTKDQSGNVPGIRLGAAPASIGFSPDSKWLVVAVPTLAGGRLLLYGPDDLQGPYSIPGTVPGTQVLIYIPGT